MEDGKTWLQEVTTTVVAAEMCTSARSSSSWSRLVPLPPMKWTPLLPVRPHRWPLCWRSAEEWGSQDVQHLRFQQGGLWRPIAVKLSLREWWQTPCMNPTTAPRTTRNVPNNLFLSTFRWMWNKKQGHHSICTWCITSSLTAIFSIKDLWTVMQNL